MTTIPTFNEYAENQYLQAIQRGITERAKALAYAAEQTALAVQVGLCGDNDLESAARAVITKYDRNQGAAADRVLDSMAHGTVGTPAGVNATWAKGLIVILGDGDRKILGDCTVQDLDRMTKVRRDNVNTQRRSFRAWESNFATVRDDIETYETVGPALDSGVFSAGSVKRTNLSGAKGKRIVSKPKGADA